MGTKKTATKQTKFIFVSGGVVSSLGSVVIWLGDGPDS